MVKRLEEVKPHLSPAQVAERYRVCLGTVYVWDKRGIMPKSKKLGRRRFWWLSELEDWEDAGFPSQVITAENHKVELC